MSESNRPPGGEKKFIHEDFLDFSAIKSLHEDDEKMNRFENEDEIVLDLIGAKSMKNSKKMFSDDFRILKHGYSDSDCSFPHEEGMGIRHKIIENKNDESEIEALINNKITQLKTPKNFNILICGKAGIGKSTFIDAFRSKYDENMEIIRAPTNNFHSYIVQKLQGDTTININIIDSPGYGENLSHEDWFKLLKEFLKRKFLDYKNYRKSLPPFFHNMIGLRFFDVDNRVHVCLYFLEGPRIKREDVLNMKKLQKYVNVIPILARGDCYTPDEIKEIKLNLIKEADDYKLEWFDCIMALQDYPDIIKLMNEGNFGPSPPFLIISSAEKIVVDESKISYGRKYNWGTCDIENPNHSDFQMLNQILINYLSFALINMTGIHYDKFLQRMKTKKKRNKLEKKLENQKKIGMGTAAILSVIGILTYITKRK